MLKKIIITVLLVTVTGAGAAALVYNITNKNNESVETIPEETTSSISPLSQNQGQGVLTAQAGQGERALAAEGAAGDPWKEAGTIAEIDDFGFDFTLQSGESVYIELGPPDYWQNQGVELQTGQPAIVSGTINEGMIHAFQVMLADGQTLRVRSESGQPLWSGGASRGQGQNPGGAEGEHAQQPQVLVAEWITLQGTILSFQGGNMTMATAEGQVITFQIGQPRFFAEQGITFNVGDEIIVVGFYQNEQFMAGDITQVATGAKVMLRDPNGRPLWAGPGNGNGNGGGGSH